MPKSVKVAPELFKDRQNDLDKFITNRTFDLHSSVEFTPKPYTYLEIWNFEDSFEVRTGEEESDDDDNEFKGCSLEEFLEQKGNYISPEKQYSKKVIGGLRLVLQKWDKDDEVFSYYRSIPFTQKDFELLTEKFYLPRDYLYSYVQEQIVAPRLRHYPDTKRITTTLQSYDSSSCFITSVLSYSTETRITSGFVGYSDHEDLDTLISSIKATGVYASSILFVPVIVYSYWIEVYRMDTKFCSDEVDKVEEKMQKLSRVSGSREGDDDSRRNRERNKRLLSPKKVDRIHDKILEVLRHASMTIVPFTREFGIVLIESLGEMMKLEADAGLEKRRVKTAEMLELCRMLQGHGNGMELFREKALSDIDVQLKVLYNLMAQREARSTQSIALAAKRDSTSMKAIATLTMIFLPATAVATIFSMNPFFTSTADSATLTTSPNLWIFWAITVPLTILVLFAWIIWTLLSGGFEDTTKKLKALWKQRSKWQGKLRRRLRRWRRRLGGKMLTMRRLGRVKKEKDQNVDLESLEHESSSEEEERGNGNEVSNSSSSSTSIARSGSRVSVGRTSGVVGSIRSGEGRNSRTDGRGSTEEERRT